MAGGRYGNPYYDDPNIAVISSNIAKMFAPPDAGKAAAARLHQLQADELDRRLYNRQRNSEEFLRPDGLTPEAQARLTARSLAAGDDPRLLSGHNLYYQSTTGQPVSVIGQALVATGKTLGPHDGVTIGDRDTIIRNQEEQAARRSAISAGPGYASVAEQRRNHDQMLAWEREKFQGTPHNVPPDNTVFFRPGDDRFRDVETGFRTGSKEPGSVQAREVKILDVLKRNPGMDPGEAGKIVDGRVKYEIPPDQPGVVVRIDMETGKAQRVPISAPPSVGGPAPAPAPAPGPGPAPVSAPATTSIPDAFKPGRNPYDATSGILPSAGRNLDWLVPPVGLYNQLAGTSSAPQTRAATTDAMLLNQKIARGLMVGRADKERRELLELLPTFGPMSNPRDQLAKLEVIHRKVSSELEADRARLQQPMTPRSRSEVEDRVRASEDVLRDIEQFVTAAPGGAAAPPPSGGPVTEQFRPPQSPARPTAPAPRGGQRLRYNPNTGNLE